MDDNTKPAAAAADAQPSDASARKNRKKLKSKHPKKKHQAEQQQQGESSAGKQKQQDNSRKQQQQQQKSKKKKDNSKGPSSSSAASTSKGDAGRKQNRRQKQNKGKSTVTKRPAPKFIGNRDTDFLINRNAPFNVQLEKATKMIASKPEVTLYGLGAAINRCINLSLQLERRLQGTVTLSVNTATVQLLDHIKPLDEPAILATRNNSAISVTIKKSEILLHSS